MGRLAGARRRARLAENRSLSPFGQADLAASRDTETVARLICDKSVVQVQIAACPVLYVVAASKLVDTSLPEDEVDSGRYAGQDLGRS
jgi:hypothetical protein